MNIDIQTILKQHHSKTLTKPKHYHSLSRSTRTNFIPPQCQHTKEENTRGEGQDLYRPRFDACVLHDVIEHRLKNTLVCTRCWIFQHFPAFAYCPRYYLVRWIVRCGEHWRTPRRDALPFRFSTTSRRQELRQIVPRVRHATSEKRDWERT